MRQRKATPSEHHQAEAQREAAMRLVADRLGPAATWTQIKAAARESGIDLDKPCRRDRRERVTWRPAPPPAPAAEVTDAEVVDILRRIGPEASISDVCAVLYRAGRPDTTVAQLKRARRLAGFTDVATAGTIHVTA